jgi:membrane dipeptidase
MDAATLHAQAIVIDGHADSFMHLDHEDLTQSSGEPRDFLLDNLVGHLDWPRFAAAGINLSIQAAWTPPARGGAAGLAYACDLLGRARAAVRRSAGALRLVEACADLDRLDEAPALMLLLEGAEPLDGRIARFEIFDALGVRILGLTHNAANAAAGGCSAASADDHLTAFGRELAALAEVHGWLLDVAHLGARSLSQLLDQARGPLVSSHTGMAARCPIPRNITDTFARAIADSDGLVAIDFVPEHLATTLPVDREVVFEHIDYAVTLLGSDHVAIGSDFDGYTTPLGGMHDARDYPWLTERMLRAGYPQTAIRQILGGNWLRVLRTTLARRA